MDLEEILDISDEMIFDGVDPLQSAKIIDNINTKFRLRNIEKRQVESASMFNRLMVIMDQIQENFQKSPLEEESPKMPAFIADHNYAFSNNSSGVSSDSSSPTPSSLSTEVDDPPQIFNRSIYPSAKRKLIDDDDDEQEYHEFSAEDEKKSIKQQQQEYSTELKYPLVFDNLVILGPNGTQIDTRSYTSIIWSSAASATRQLLAFVFTSDILATHTLTGKPSPAFYGRERPPKMQLDPIKASDIIYCVRAKFNCSEREIRAAITTKCSDTSKKYKRRNQKQLESSNKL